MSEQKSDDNALIPKVSGALTSGPLASVDGLISTFAVNEMEFTVGADGSKTAKGTPNKDREQCGVCWKWFPDRDRLDVHKMEKPSGCEVHHICFEKKEVPYHGTYERHTRCFVRGCGHAQRKDGAYLWTEADIEQHIRDQHWEG